MRAAVIVLAVIVFILIHVVIFLWSAFDAYQAAYLFNKAAIERICQAGNTYDEALAIMSAKYHLPEDEVIRRLQSGSQTSST